MNGTPGFQAPDEQDFALLERRLLTEIGKREQGRRRRRRAFVAGGVTLAVLGGASIAAVTLASDAQQTRSAYCYAAADTGSRFTQVVSPDEMMDPSGRKLPVDAPPQDQLGAAAAEMCAAVWRIGFFESDAPPADDGVEHAVPPLQDCLRSDRVPAVFPRDDQDTRPAAEFCAALGLLGPASPGTR